MYLNNFLYADVAVITPYTTKNTLFIQKGNAAALEECCY